MSLVITQRPVITSPIVSRWNGVVTPILYKLCRKDFVFDQVNNNAGNVQLQFNGVNIASSFTVNDVVWVESDNAVYSASGLITASTYSAPDTFVTVNIAYTAAAPGGYVNNNTTRLNYKAKIGVYTSSLVGYLVLSPDRKGDIIADISKVLKNNLVDDIDLDLTTAADLYNDTGAYRSFYIDYAENWIGSTGSPTSDVANVYYCAYGGVQIPSLYGGNMVLFLINTTNQYNFLTPFTTVSFWEGWPCLLSAIINVPGVNTYLSDGTNNSTLAINDNELITYDINQFITPTSDTFNVAIYEVAGPPAIRRSELKTVIVKEPCENPVMLMGRNYLGGLFTWMFSYSQDYTYVYEDGKKAKRAVLFAENLTLNEWESLHDFFSVGEIYKRNIVEFTNATLLTSKRIGSQVYQIDQDGNKLGVIVIQTGNSTRTRQTKHTFTIEIEYPEIFTT